MTTLHLLRAAEAGNEPLTDVAARLTRLGYRPGPSPDEILVDHLDPDDTTMASVDLDGAQPWLDIDQAGAGASTCCGRPASSAATCTTSRPG